jgi:hypothetical protein
MIKCNGCGVNISYGMRHAINKNICPFCGQRIMSEESLADVNIITKKIRSLESFSALQTKIDDRAFDSLLNEISMLFCFSLKQDAEISAVQAKRIAQRNAQNIAASDASTHDGTSFEDIRRQVEQEMNLDFNREDSDSSEDSSLISGDDRTDIDSDDEDYDDRITRLKNLHVKAKDVISRVNKPIRRIG